MIDNVLWLGVTSTSLVILLNKSAPTLTTITNLYWVITPLGVDGCLQLNVTLVLVGVEVKFCGASSGPIWRIQN